MHAHDHSAHDHAPKNYNAAFAIGIALNVLYIIFEVVFGLASHSLALVADAGHNLSDAFGLLLAWGASYLSTFRPTKHRTYGLRSTSILAALFNALLLLVAVGAIGWEAVRRFAEPTAVAGKTVMWVAGLGVVINAATALLFMSGRKGDLNIRGAFLHMAADAGVSVGVVAAGLVILWTGRHWIDPVVSLAIVAVILVGTWGLLRDSVNLALQAVPAGVDVDAVRAYLATLPAVVKVHDVHIWGMSTTETALTAHLVRSEMTGADSLLERAARELHDRFQIVHATLQLESEECSCGLEPEEKV